VAQFAEDDQKKVKFIYNFEEEEKPGLFAALDVFAYPSGYESFGIAFIEAWSSGKPVIGCRRGAIPWVVDAGHDGLLVEYKDPSQLGEAILQLLQNPGWAQAMGRAGRRKVLTQYTWEVVACRFRQVYEKTIEMQLTKVSS
jgi:glycosyltransferase involved in cell wall biosynthesis